MPRRHQNKGWKWGEKTKLAREAGITLPHLYGIFAGNRDASRKMATKITRAAERLGIPLSRQDVMFPKESRNPLILDFLL